MLLAPARPRARVLVVDDDASVREVCTMLLHALGYGALLASSGRMAMERLAQTADPVQVVLLDLKMPGMRGDEILHMLKAMHPNVPVLLMSGMPNSALQPYLARGADAVLCKPFRLSQLEHALRLALRHSLPLFPADSSRRREDEKSGIQRCDGADDLDERALRARRALR